LPFAHSAFVFAKVPELSRASEGFSISSSYFKREKENIKALGVDDLEFLIRSKKLRRGRAAFHEFSTPASLEPLSFGSVALSCQR
jgi:hypothetical protein